ncbi:MAG: pyridoxamine 5'-phosphate oxidase family protein [Pseudomonadales bacterium]|nr:pyridoxamine 5'-phosphate oxidase family protein [Pseudomonadales bacterium]
MGKLYSELDDKLCEFIRSQHMFFIATAPRSDEGSVNCSPKGLDTLRILDEHTLAYLDLTGSGAETIAHLKENGRFVLMFCSFSNKPLILRLHGKGEVLEKGDAGYDDLIGEFPDMRGTRSIIKLNVTRIADSCGWGVPRYEYQGDRDTYFKFADSLSDDEMAQARKEGNAHSIDGLPALSRFGV